MAWTDSPDIIDMQQDPQGVYSPFSRKRSIPDPYGLDNSPSQDAITLNSPAHDAYRPTLARTGEAAPSAPSSPAANPYAARLTDLGNQLQSAYAAPHAGTARQILGALFARKNPQLGGLISGETQRERKIEPLQEEYGLVSNIIAANRAQQTTDITNRLHNAQADYFEQRPDLMNKPKPTPQEQALQDYMGRINPGTGKNYSPAEALKQVNQDAQDVKPDAALKAPSEEDKAISDLLGSKNLPNTAPNRDKARSILKTRDRKPVDEDLADMNKQLKKAQLEKAMEATPDEQRRADLAGNLEENLTNLEDIARRRPELFGPLQGRLTGAKQTIGSSDPDVAALKVIEEQTGLAMVGAHAMRNAQHAEKAAQSITGANHTPASALLAPNGPIAKARQSLATFKADAGRRRKAITGEGEPAGPAQGGGKEIHYKIVNGELVPQ